MTSHGNAAGKSNLDFWRSPSEPTSLTTMPVSPGASIIIIPEIIADFVALIPGFLHQSPWCLACCGTDYLGANTSFGSQAKSAGMSPL